MPNRIIKESICTSDEIDRLSWFEEAFFYRLIVNCDDYGRFDGRPAVIKSRLFPLKDNVTAKSVEAAIHKLASVELVALYEFEGKPYLHLPTWDKHQQIRAQKSKYPAPEDGMYTSDIICNQLKSDDIKCPRNPIQSESNPNPNPNPESESKTARTAQADEPDLSAFGSELQKAVTEWLAYKKEKGNTYKPTGLTRLLTQIKNYAGQYGEAEIVKLIETCEARNYQGIIFDLLDKKKSSGSAQRFSGNSDHDEEGGGFF